MTHRSCYLVSSRLVGDLVAYIEVGEDDNETSVLGTEHVFGGHLDVVEGNVGSSGCGRVGRLDLLRLDSLSSRYEECSQTAISLP